jgi:L-fucose isomerase-like protein
MKARLVPVYFKSGMDEAFRRHLALVKDHLAEEAEVLEPVALGAKLPPADAVVFPQLIGDAFSQLDALKGLGLPVLVLTSDFGTVNMWDWEIVTFLKSLGVKTFTPYDIGLAKTVCRALALRREMRDVKFLVFQDQPGVGGEQPEIFRRFWWWEDRASELIRDTFGIRIVKKSFRALGEEAARIGDAEARRALESRPVPAEGLAEKPLLSAMKLYLAVRRHLDEDPAIQGAGINCLNESAFSDTTPCLAWDILYQERRLIWACEADTLSMLTIYLLERALRVPVMMSNLYPFLMGLSALQHEKIDRFPQVPEPENHLLMVHCGYFGVVPRSFCTSWKLKPKVLGIVDDNATMIDGRMAEGPMTLAKLHPELKSLQVIEGELEGYAQYPGSDCRNGAMLRVRDGRALMGSFFSHHYCLASGKLRAEMETLTGALDIGAEIL